MKTRGTFYYMSTRNNNFSNRDQRGTIMVVNLLPDWAIATVVVGGVLFLGTGGMAGAMFYSKLRPHSRVAQLVSKISNRT
jgi:hypothetical protein